MDRPRALDHGRQSMCQTRRYGDSPRITPPTASTALPNHERERTNYFAGIGMVPLVEGATGAMVPGVVISRSNPPPETLPLVVPP